MSERDLLINRIRDGTVLDHLESGSAFTVLAALDVSGSDGNQVSVAMNVPSRKVGKKDIIKVENRFKGELVCNARYNRNYSLWV